MLTTSKSQVCHSERMSGSSRMNHGGSGVFLTAVLCAVVFSCFAASGQNKINTVAGGAPSIGTATASDLAGPSAVVKDAAGNIYVTSPFEQWVYKLSAGQLS